MLIALGRGQVNQHIWDVLTAFDDVPLEGPAMGRALAERGGENLGKAPYSAMRDLRNTLYSSRFAFRVIFVPHDL